MAGLGEEIVLHSGARQLVRGECGAGVIAAMTVGAGVEAERGVHREDASLKAGMNKSNTFQSR